MATFWFLEHTFFVSTTSLAKFQIVIGWKLKHWAYEQQVGV